MFIAAMSTVAKLWKEPQCPLTDEWIKKMWSVYTMEYSSAIRKDKYPPIASTWLELEGIMLSEVSQSEKDNHHMVSLMWNIRNSEQDYKGKEGNDVAKIREGDKP